MGYVPGFKYDIFISYAHIDNDPLIQGVPGWVDFFEQLLRKSLRVELGAEVEIFRDAQLNGFEPFSEQLGQALEQSAVLLALISPRYIKAEWCLWELREFQKRTGGGRLIKVVKSSIEGKSFRLDGQELLTSVKDVLEHRMYYEDERSGRHIDLQPELKNRDIPDFVDKVNAICEDLDHLFRHMRGAASPLNSPASASALPLAPVPISAAPAPNSIPAPTPAPPSPPAFQSNLNQTGAAELPAVYLAEPAKDQVENHRLIKSELQQFKFRVLPDQPLPTDVEEFNTAVQQYLAQAKLSVHLLGESYGGILDVDVEERSKPHIQYDLATALAQAKRLTQLVWLPPGLTLKAGSQQERFVTQVKNNTPELLQVKLEDLKTEIHKKLKPAPKDIWAELAGDPVTVCLFCHEQDFAQVGPLFSYLKLEEAYKVKLPLQDQEPPEKYKQLLQSSDAVLLYYGAADEEWFGNIWRVIQKLSATGRTKPLLAKAIYIGESMTKEKDLLNSSDPLVLKNYAPFTPETIAPFIQRIRAATEAQ